MTFKTILVAVDGSTHAAKTVEVAGDVAQRYGAKLVILHVVARIYEGRVRDELANFASIEHMEQTEYEMLQELGREIVQSAGLSARQKGITNVETVVDVGDPASIIVSMTEREARIDSSWSARPWHLGQAAARACHKVTS
jgi:nucleotide-binding universal stress UspA family protein